MNSLLLVEDEPLERQALKMELENGDYGISKIYEAANGQEAWETFTAEQPDILIVDINIPVFSGLDLIKKIVETDAACKILITTTYDRSKYVRTAISLGVTDYLLKPVDYTQMKKAIKKCRDLLEEERRKNRKFDQLYSYTQHHVLEGMLLEELSWSDEDIAGIMDIEPKEQIYAGIVICTAERTHFEHELTKLLVPDFALLTAYISGRNVAVIHPKGVCSKEHAIARIRVYMKRLFRNLSEYGQFRLICCEPAEQFQVLKQIYEKTDKILDKKPEKKIQIPAMPSARLCKSSEEKQRLGQKWLNKLYQRDAERLIRSIKRRMLKGDAYWEGADLFCSVFEKMDSSVDLDLLFQCFEQKSPYEALQQFVSHYYTGHDLGPDKEENSVAERIQSILQREFVRDITQAEVAEELGMSASYFSTLFKKEFGSSFTDVINTMRIDRAVMLIDSGVTDTGKIAQSCGFTNRKYFLQVFRKHMNKTVAEYMEAGKSEQDVFS